MTDQTKSTDQDYTAWLMSRSGGSCAEVKSIGDGLYAAIKPLLFHWTLVVGEVGDTMGYLRRWCYADRQKAEAALRAWDGIGEPTGWHRDPYTSRRRPDGDPAREYIAP